MGQLLNTAGYGKGAPDGVGATCKRTADRVVASGTDISSLEDLSQALQKSCPNIILLTIDDAYISDKKTIFRSEENIKTFLGTLKVHQVSGSVFFPDRLIMKSLNCFRDRDPESKNWC
ncbi:hypothetical protein PV326_012495, partial [Microctonus aethiopoides]